MIEPVWITLGGMAVAAVVWAVRQEGRINALDQLNRQLRDDVTYIRNRIDSALNGRH